MPREHHYLIHPKDMVAVLRALDEFAVTQTSRIARDLRAQFEQHVLPVTIECKPSLTPVKP